jgi:hypothetical protein
MLRVIAGAGDAHLLLPQMIRAVVALEKFAEGQSYVAKAVLIEAALRLGDATAPRGFGRRAIDDENRDRGLRLIRTGSLRFAAESLRGDDPYFYGKQSVDLIERGIDLLKPDHETQPRSVTRKETAAPKAPKLREAEVQKGLREPRSPAAPTKPWSSRDSRSWRDPKPDGE